MTELCRYHRPNGDLHDLYSAIHCDIGNYDVITVRPLPKPLAWW